MTLKGWKWRTLVDIVIKGGIQIGPFGSQLKASEYVASTDGIPVVMPKDILGCQISSETIARVSSEKANTLRKHFLKEGDLVFGRRGDIGRCALVSANEEGWLCGSGCLRARLSIDVEPKFISYQVQQKDSIFWLESNAVGQTMLNLNTSILSDLPLYVGPPEEQRVIIEILEAWDDAIATTEKLITAKQKLKSALVQKLMYGVRKELFSTWKLVRFREVVSQYIDYRGKTPLKIGLSWGDGFIKALSANNVQVGYIDFSRECKLGSETLYDAWMKHGDCEKGDVLLTMEAPLGNVAQIPDDEKYILSQRVILIKPKTELVSKDFLALFMATPYFQNELLRNSSGTTAIGIQRKRLDKIKFCLPSTKEQKKIADVLSTINKTIYIHQEKLILLKKQKKGLMQKLLTGEWSVKVKEAA